MGREDQDHFGDPYFNTDGWVDLLQKPAHGEGGA